MGKKEDKEVRRWRGKGDEYSILWTKEGLMPVSLSLFPIINSFVQCGITNAEEGAKTDRGKKQNCF